MMAKIYNIDYFRHLRTPNCWNGITGEPPEGWVGTWSPPPPYGPPPMKARLKRILKRLSLLAELKEFKRRKAEREARKAKVIKLFVDDETKITV